MGSKKKAQEPTITRGFKGFDKGLKCRGMQFEVGKTFTVEGAPKLCESGLHFCEYPLDVFIYYPPAGNRFCVVETDCVSPETHDDDSKRVTTSLSIVRELDLPGIIKAAIDSTMTSAKPAEGSSNSGYRGVASNSGTRGAASNSGDYGAASNSGDSGVASNSGHRGVASNSGYRGVASNSGDYGAASNSGNYGAASNSGYKGAASNSGDYGVASNSGNYGVASNSGYRGVASNSGDYGAASNSGYSGVASTEGKDSCAFSGGYDSMVKGALGCAICCVERDEEQDYKIVSVLSAIVDGEKIKADTFYTVRNGEWVEVSND